MVSAPLGIWYAKSSIASAECGLRHLLEIACPRGLERLRRVGGNQCFVHDAVLSVMRSGNSLVVLKNDVLLIDFAINTIAKIKHETSIDITNLIALVGTDYRRGLPPARVWISKQIRTGIWGSSAEVKLLYS